jgi:MarR family transcriptional regulator, lower aerobic nicotinate degradation pathway regulator
VGRIVCTTNDPSRVEFVVAMIGETRPPEALGEYTGFLMNWLALRSRAAFAEAIEELGLRPPHFGLLTVIADRPGQTQQALAATTGIDTSSMVQSLDALEQAGFAERRPHPTDRRKRAVHVTPKGEEVLRRGREKALEVGDEAFGALTKAERRELHRLLRKLARLD